MHWISSLHGVSTVASVVETFQARVASSPRPDTQINIQTMQTVYTPSHSLLALSLPWQFCGSISIRIQYMGSMLNVQVALMTTSTSEMAIQKSSHAWANSVETITLHFFRRTGTICGFGKRLLLLFRFTLVVSGNWQSQGSCNIFILINNNTHKTQTN